MDLPRFSSPLVTRVGGTLAVLLILVVAAVLARPAPDPDDDGLIAVSPVRQTVTPTAGPTALDADIERFTARVDESGTYVDVRTLGSLHFQRARLTGSGADYALADELLTAAVGRDPTDPDAGVLLATTALARHDFARGRAVARDVLTLDPQRFDALAVEADALLDLGHDEAALANLLLLEDVLPDDPSISIRLAEVAFATGDHAGVRSHMREAVAKSRSIPGSPNLAVYLTYVGDRARALGDISEAAAALEEALELVPGDTTAAFALGWVRVSQGDLVTARDLFDDVAGVLPEPDHLQALGDVHTALGDHDAAAGAYQLATTASAALVDDPTWRGHVARYLVEHGDSAEALRIAELEIESRSDPATYGLYGWALYENGRFEDARDAFDVALATGYRTPRLLYGSALVWRSLGSHGAAAADAAAAVAIDQNFHPLHSGTAQEIAGNG